MTKQTVAGVDWAGGEWLAVIFRNGCYTECFLEDEFETLWECTPDFDQMLIDVPIGLPDTEKTLANREELDSLARSATGRSSSVFPVPSRGSCELAMAGEDYETVVRENQDEIGKGLSKQSYYIAEGIGEVDDFLRNTESASEIVLESHPEVCFRGLLRRQLQHSKNTAAGVSERLNALDVYLDSSGTVFEQICGELAEESSDVTVDDVVDALGLSVVAWKSLEESQFLPQNKNYDSEGLPMQMAYWSKEPLL